MLGRSTRELARQWGRRTSARSSTATTWCCCAADRLRERRRGPGAEAVGRRPTAPVRRRGPRCGREVGRGLDGAGALPLPSPAVAGDGGLRRRTGRAWPRCAPRWTALVESGRSSLSARYGRDRAELRYWDEAARRGRRGRAGPAAVARAPRERGAAGLARRWRSRSSTARPRAAGVSGAWSRRAVAGQVRPLYAAGRGAAARRAAPAGTAAHHVGGRPTLGLSERSAVATAPAPSVAEPSASAPSVAAPSMAAPRGRRPRTTRRARRSARPAGAPRPPRGCSPRRPARPRTPRCARSPTRWSTATERIVAGQRRRPGPRGARRAGRRAARPAAAGRRAGGRHRRRRARRRGAARPGRARSCAARPSQRAAAASAPRAHGRRRHGLRGPAQRDRRRRRCWPSRAATPSCCAAARRRRPRTPSSSTCCARRCRAVRAAAGRRQEHRRARPRRRAAPHARPRPGRRARPARRARTSSAPSWRRRPCRSSRPAAATATCFVDASADLDQALAIALNSKVQRPSVCNAAETVLVHADVAARVPAEAAARAAGRRASSFTADARVRRAGDAADVPVQPATDEDWAAEYHALEVAVGVVDSLDAAVEHIRRWSSGHTEAICTSDLRAARPLRRRRRLGRGRGERLDPVHRRRASSGSAPRSASRRRSCTPAGRWGWPS